MPHPRTRPQREARHHGMRGTVRRARRCHAQCPPGASMMLVAQARRWLSWACAAYVSARRAGLATARRFGRASPRGGRLLPNSMRPLGWEGRRVQATPFAECRPCVWEHALQAQISAPEIQLRSCTAVLLPGFARAGRVRANGRPEDVVRFKDRSGTIDPFGRCRSKLCSTTKALILPFPC